MYTLYSLQIYAGFSALFYFLLAEREAFFLTIAEILYGILALLTIINFLREWNNDA